MDIIYNDNTLTAYLEGEIDHHAAKLMREEIDIKIERHKPKLLVLDFSKVSFMDSSGIGLVLGRYRLISQYGGKICIDNTPAYIKKVMKLAGIERVSTFAKSGDGGRDKDKNSEDTKEIVL